MIGGKHSNGKTTLCAWIILYLLVADGEIAAEVYTAANSQKQASKIWTECRDILALSPQLKQILEPIKSESRIVFEATRSMFAAISSSPQSAEGLNASGCVIDEIHRFNTIRDEDFFNALRWSGKSRRNPLFVTISTAGIFDPTSCGWKHYKVASDILKGINTQTDILPLIFEIDPEVDWSTKNPKCEEVWKKCNPSLGVTMDLEDFRKDVEAVEQNPSQLSAFLRYNFNLWASSSYSWVTDERWMTCKGNTDLTQDEINSMTWTAGLDLARSIDLTALVLIGRDEENQRSIVKPFFWCSQEMASARQRNDQVNYETWSKPSRTGEWNEPPIRTNDGDTIDFNKVRRDAAEICEKYNVSKIAIDRWSANSTAQQLQDDGLPITFYGQGFKDMSPAVIEIERQIFSGEIIHDCPVLRWMMSNVELVSDDAGNVKVSRKRSREKVDGVISLCMAVGVTLNAPPLNSYQKRARRKAREAKEKANANHT